MHSWLSSDSAASSPNNGEPNNLLRAPKENKNTVKPQRRTTTNAFPTVVVLLEV